MHRRSEEAVLVLVDLNGPQFPIGKGGALDFTATSGKTRLSHRWQSLEHSYVSDSGHITLPFLVYGVACEPIKISVVLFAGGKRSTKTEVIPLACGVTSRCERVAAPRPALSS